SGEPASLDDCQSLANYLSNRGQTHTVPRGKDLVVVWNTCQFRFENSGAVDAIWCDSTWASESARIAQSCIPQGSTSAACTYTLMNLYMSRNTGSLTTPSDAGGQAPTSSSGVTESSSSGSSSTTSTSSSTTSISGSSLTGQTSTSILASAPLLEVSHSSDGGLVSDNNQGSNTAVITGTVVGIVVVVLLVLVVLWVLRRRKQSNTLGSATNTGSNDGPKLESIQGVQPFTSEASPSPTASALALWDHSAKGAGLLASKRSPELISSMPNFSSAAQLDMPTTAIPEEPENPPAASDDSESSVSGEQLQQRGPPVSFRPTYGVLRGGNRSMSARSLAQALAPQLSEDDIDRLANSIVTRMPVAPIVPHGLRTPTVSRDQAGSDVGVESQDDPPPPWRESWGSNRGTRPVT
ncbi:hypothetical protein FRC18_007974, partial [Serendipita sp. 400]